MSAGGDEGALCGCPTARSFGGGTITVLHDQGCPEAPRLIAGPARHLNGEVKLPRIRGESARYGSDLDNVPLPPILTDDPKHWIKTDDELDLNGRPPWPDRYPRLWSLLRSVLPRSTFRRLVLRVIPDDSPTMPQSAHDLVERAAFYERGARPSGTLNDGPR